MISKLKIGIVDKILKMVFFTAPELKLDLEKKKIFDNLISSMNRSNKLEIDYPSPYPKHEFLRYLVKNHPVLLHGSNNTEIEELSPRPQSDWNGKRIEAVFASGDGIWPMFFATVKQKGYHGSFRNGCFAVKLDESRENRYYFFSLNKAFQEKNPWQDGMIYILPKQSFNQTSTGAVRFDEWASPQPVKPIAKLRINPQDFPFLRNVSWHDEKEKIYISWLKYKHRQTRIK